MYVANRQEQVLYTQVLGGTLNNIGSLSTSSTSPLYTCPLTESPVTGLLKPICGLTRTYTSQETSSSPVNTVQLNDVQVAGRGYDGGMYIVGSTGNPVGVDYPLMVAGLGSGGTFPIAGSHGLPIQTAAIYEPSADEKENNSIPNVDRIIIRGINTDGSVSVGGSAGSAFTQGAGLGAGAFINASQASNALNSLTSLRVLAGGANVAAVPNTPIDGVRTYVQA